MSRIMAILSSFGIVFVCSQCSVTEKFHVLAIEKKEATISVSDTLSDNFLIQLDTNEYILVQALPKEKVHYLKGPFKGTITEGILRQKNGFRKGSFGFLTSHRSLDKVLFEELVINSDKKEIPILNLKPDELILTDQIMLKSKDRKKNFSYSVLYEKDTITYGKCKNETIIHHLHGLRKRKEDISLQIDLQTETNILSSSIIFASEKTKYNLEKQERKLIEEKVPIERLICFYLKYKLFRKADILLKNSQRKSAFLKDVAQIIE